MSNMEQLVGNLMSADNNVRGTAEALFNESKKQPDMLVVSLVQLIRASQHEQIRSLSTILLRRVLSKGTDSLWPLISAQSQEAVKTQLLQALDVEKSATARSNLGDCIAHLGSLIIEKGGRWDELLPFMFKCTKSEDASQRESALNIFATLATHIGENLRPYFNVLKDVLAAGLNDTNNAVKLAALDATANFLQVLDEPQERNIFQQLTPPMFSTISAALNANDEEDARTALEVFVDLAEIDPTFLRPHLALAINAMLQIAGANHLEDATKQLAVEFLVTLAENKPTMMRKYPKFLESLLPLILNLMMDLEDDEDWHNQKTKTMMTSTLQILTLVKNL